MANDSVWLSNQNLLEILKTTFLAQNGCGQVGDLYGPVGVALGRRLNDLDKARVRRFVNFYARNNGYVCADTTRRIKACWKLTPSVLGSPIPSSKDMEQAILSALKGVSEDEPMLLGYLFVKMLKALGVDPHNIPPSWKMQAEEVKSRYAEAILSLRAQGKVHKTLLCLVEQVPETKARNGKNATAKWLDVHLRPKSGQTESSLYAMMKHAVAKRLPISAKSDMVDDHVQTFIMRIVRRDALAKMLEEGKSVPYSKVVSYCVNSGRTDARDMGTEPVCRTFYGALTEGERKLKSSGDLEVSALPTSSTDFWDEDTIVAIEDFDDTKLSFDSLWSRVTETLGDYDGDVSEMYSRLLAMKAMGYSFKEIALSLNLTVNQVSSMLSMARSVVREDVREEYVRVQ